ncbi:MAG: hypothetical protein H0T42_29995 [Deltaproteobacteria bacterium]|nr:hypothetical protein [Deltaproteobacteria bacterium]
MCARWFVGLIAVTSGCAFGIDDTVPESDDPDHDGIADDGRDNCPGLPNPDQADANGDDVGDACSTFCTGLCSDPLTCVCADFDDSPELPADWALVPEGTASGGIGTGDVRSPPRALGLMVPKGPADGNRNHVSFSRGLLATNLHIVYETDWKLSYYDETTNAHTIQFTGVFLANIANVSLGYAFNGTAGDWFIAKSVLGMGTTIYPIARPPTDASTWMHIRFDVLFDQAGAGHIYVAFNGAEVVHEDNLVTAPATTGPQTVAAMANIWTHQGTTPFAQVTHDNLVFRVD